MSKPARVCVIGAGPQGLAALKNLIELNAPDDQIFDVDLLEARDSVGGVWKFTEDKSEITALHNTLQNTSIFKNCYSDFPPTDAWMHGGRNGAVPLYLDQEQTAFYLEQYAEHFNLLTHIRFGWKATLLGRADSEGQWRISALHVASGEVKTEYYDKVIVATGQHFSPLVPNIEGLEHFSGKTVHSAEFKSKDSFENQSVLIIGSSNSAGDIATELAGTAKNVLVSHRRGVNISPRQLDYRPFDVVLTRRLDSIICAVTSLAPAYMTALIAKQMEKTAAAAWKGRIKPEWGLSKQTAPSFFFTSPMVSETIIPLLEAGTIRFVPGIVRVLEDGTIELQDGQKVQVDTIIYCTGYEIDSTLTGPVQFQGERELPRLYQKIYHPEYPDSLAYLTFWHTIAGICELGDLATMGIAQVFAHRYQLPDRPAMEKQIDMSQAFVNALATRSPQPITNHTAQRCLDRGPFIEFLHEVAGTQVKEKLGYGLEGWKFWWSDREFCNLLMTGIDSIYNARLFDSRPGGRKKWDGARQAIIDANEDLKRFEKKARDEDAARKNKTL